MAQQHAAALDGDTQLDQKPAGQAEKGPGVQALEALLQKGQPEPKKVVAIIDTYRGERDALFALLHQTLGNAFVQSVVSEMDGLRASIKNREVVAGDPGNPDDGYFLASAKKQGAEWRTADGSFTGKVDKKGLDSTYKLDDDDTLRAQVSSKGEGTLAWQRDGETQAELYAKKKDDETQAEQYGKKKDDELALGVRRPFELGSGTLSAGLEHKGGFNGAVVGYETEDKKFSADGAAGIKYGSFAGSLGAKWKNDRTSLAGELEHDAKRTGLSLSGSHTLDNGHRIWGSADVARSSEGTTGSVGAGWTNGTTSLEGRYSHDLEADRLHFGGTHRFSDRLSMTSSLGHERRFDGGRQTTFGLAQSYRSDRLVQGLSLDAGAGDRNYLGITGSADMQVGRGLYAGAWGHIRGEDGKQIDSQLGASLTFTPSERTALTLAGVFNQDGGFETRLQFDMFKSKIENVGQLSDNKKKALVSLFLSYSQGMSGGSSMMDSRFGAPQIGGGQNMGGGQLMGGIKLTF